MTSGSGRRCWGRDRLLLLLDLRGCREARCSLRGALRSRLSHRCRTFGGWVTWRLRGRANPHSKGFILPLSLWSSSVTARRVVGSKRTVSARNGAWPRRAICWALRCKPKKAISCRMDTGMMHNRYWSLHQFRQSITWCWDSTEKKLFCILSIVHGQSYGRQKRVQITENDQVFSPQSLQQRQVHILHIARYLGNTCGILSGFGSGWEVAVGDTSINVKLVWFHRRLRYWGHVVHLTSIRSLGWLLLCASPQSPRSQGSMTRPQMMGSRRQHFILWQPCRPNEGVCLTRGHRVRTPYGPSSHLNSSEISISSGQFSRWGGPVKLLVFRGGNSSSELVRTLLGIGPRRRRAVVRVLRMLKDVRLLMMLSLAYLWRIHVRRGR